MSILTSNLFLGIIIAVSSLCLLVMSLRVRRVLALSRIIEDELNTVLNTILEKYNDYNIFKSNLLISKLKRNEYSEEQCKNFDDITKQELFTEDDIINMLGCDYTELYRICLTTGVSIKDLFLKINTKAKEVYYW